MDDVVQPVSRRSAVKRIGLGAAAVWAAPAIVSQARASEHGSPAPPQQCGEPAQTVIPVAYSSGGWSYRQVEHGSSDEVGLKPNESQAGYRPGTAAFGNNAGCPQPPATFWATNSDLLVNRTVHLPECATGVVVAFAIDNGLIAAYWDGTKIGGPINHEGCAGYDSVVLAVPAALSTPGPHFLGIHAEDHGGVTYLDIEVRAQTP